ncbi:PREDICTED: cleft lip and palate transmembrane protein 1-like protein [Nicrophorus vespilloides]|uniref:Lipid scramblase CLPTM1L n=1 Tax=Nicrophorus vespilloides TaxID=110193 RepID=A0ABM1MHC9_NICVS|nr:PREDICTED: cleft lip and palate transmembrane protein 1-like protein [Nicrophorus vespilloides]
MRPSVGFIISCAFIAFILHSIYTLVQIYSAPYCTGDEVCYTSYLNNKPRMELLVYTSDMGRSHATPILHVNNFNYNEPMEKVIEIDVSDSARSNGSMLIHTVLFPARGNAEFIPLSDAKNLADAVYLKSKLTKHIVPRGAAFNLLQEEAKKKSVKPVTHMKSKYVMVMCNEELHVPHLNVPFELVRYMRINSKRQFMPILIQDLLQTRMKDLEEVLADTYRMNFTFAYSPTSIGKFKFLVQMEGTFVNFMNLGFTAKDVDEVKGVFADTNLYLLCMTLFIGGIHLLLDFLSFKNYVTFWKSHKTMAGLSMRTVLWRTFSQTVIFLYLLDEGTSLFVLIPSAIGTVIEFWKITKIYKITIGWSGIKFNTNIQDTDVEAKTKKYDKESMKYLNYILYPLLLSAAVYSLVYRPHKSWYSWTIHSLSNGVYAFGFLFLLPQLFVNYRLKSVAALPWRAFMYRAFNTFIDDIFAFIITMPTSHRLACFSDDIVFFVYLYQRWLYPVDKNRVEDDGTEEINDATINDKKKIE